MSNKYKNISVISTGSWVPSDQDFIADNKGTYQVQINELVLMVSIGIHEHEKVKKQRVSISLSIQALDNLDKVDENINNVVSYEQIIKKLKNIISKGHIELLETLGEKIMDMCFEESRVMSVWMKLEKLDVFSETKSVGIELVRSKQDHSLRKSTRTNIEKIKKNNSISINVMWIVKIGGSWINNPNLSNLIKNLQRLSNKDNIIIVNGGGMFSDSVRLVYENKRMSEKTGNYIALKATELFSHLLKEIDKNICLVDDIESLRFSNKMLKIWLPSMILKNDSTFIKNWESTSDSVAAWLHSKINSLGLLYVKSLTFEKKKYKLKYLQDNGVLDKNVDKYLIKSANIKIIGQEIINLIGSSNTFREFFLDLNEVKL